MQPNPGIAVANIKVRRGNPVPPAHPRKPIYPLDELKLGECFDLPIVGLRVPQRIEYSEEASRPEYNDWSAQKLIDAGLATVEPAETIQVVWIGKGRAPTAAKLLKDHERTRKGNGSNGRKIARLQNGNGYHGLPSYKKPATVPSELIRIRDMAKALGVVITTRVVGKTLKVWRIG